MTELPKTCLPTWTVDELPEPKPLGLKNLAGLIGPGIVMCGIQIGGGEWLFGPSITAKYGGGLMWIATVAIILQVFYNIECGRYALYCGEPVFTGFMRTKPGPKFWMCVFILLCFSAFIPGLTTNAAVLISSLYLGRAPTADDQSLVNILAYVCLGIVVLPVLVGGKVYNVLQWIMTAKVAVVLGFCLFVGLTMVSWQSWVNVISGFVMFGNVPTKVDDGTEQVVNVMQYYWTNGEMPLIAMTSIALLGAFAGYAGGGGLSNSTYSNFVRDKGWGMGSRVGAIPSAVGGHHITLSHIGAVFELTTENLKRWRGWWRYILTDQLLVWVPGCFMGMALPALLSMEFAKHSPMFGKDIIYSQPLIVSDGMAHCPDLGSWAPVLSLICVFVGLMVFLPSQMSLVDDISRRWTDVIWSGSHKVRGDLQGNQVRRIYYFILAMYVAWSYFMATIFLKFGDAPAVMVTIIANFNNIAIGFTAFHILWINRTYLPQAIRPKWYQQLGIAGCGIFYLGLAALVFYAKILPLILPAQS